jgi:hypothetical protein
MKNIKTTLFYLSVTSGFTVLIYGYLRETIGKIKDGFCFRHRVIAG